MTQTLNMWSKRMRTNIAISLRLIAFTNVLLLSYSQTITTADAQEKNRPNILWIFAEDTSPWMGCYGDPVNSGQTPHIDSLAQQGIRFSRAYVPAPVCSACRSALMAGQNQIRINAHEHRSSRGPAKIELPGDIQLLPRLLKNAGYFTFNAGKTDYNFVWDEKETYSLLQSSRQNIPWAKVKENQPFFGQIQTSGGKNNTKSFPSDRKTDPSSVTVPKDYPQNDLYHEVVAQHYDAIRKDDDFIGGVLADLEKQGLRENTIVVYFSDHGANNLVRHKQMPTEGGLHVPFIISGPDTHVPASSVRDDLVNMLDLSATTLSWAGLEIPKWHEGQNLFAEKLIPRSAVFAAKDRLDHTIDRVRTVRSGRFRYTRNFKTDRILLQPQYRDSRDYVINLRELYDNGKIEDHLKEIYFGERPAEEFYDVQADPSQVINLINDPHFEREVQHHRNLLTQWISKGDYGTGEEPREELAYQANGHKWGEGVNPEYEIVRTDSDGDGLSDDWERINGRDAHDNRLMFLFDCGGWQTEGWIGQPKLGNLAGYLGFLEFALPDGDGMIVRDKLNIDSKHYPSKWFLTATTTDTTRVKLMAKFSKSKELVLLGSVTLEVGKQTEPIELESGKLKESLGALVELQLHLTAPSNTRVEIDALVSE